MPIDPNTMQPQQMDPATMQALQQQQQMMQQRLQRQQNSPMPPAQLSPDAAAAMLPQGNQGGFLGAAQANQQNPQGAMPPAGDMPPQGGISPPMPAPGGAQPPQQPPGMSPQMQQDMLMHMMQNMHPDMKQQIIQQLSSSLAAQGRGGDNTIAHVTPGEITVPPQVQSPKVLATLNKAFKDKGAAAHQFTVGSPTQSVNPNTGLPEYGFFNSGFMKAALPIALGIGGSMLLPGIGTALGAEAAGAGTAAAGAGAAAGTAAGAVPSLALSSLGSGLGTTAGGLLTGQKPVQAIMAGAGAGVGGYALGNISEGMTAMGNPSGTPATSGNLFSGATNAIPASNPWPGSGVPINTGVVGATGPQLPGVSPNTASVFGHTINPYQMLGGSIGSTAGSYLGAAMAKKQPTGPQLPPGFNTPYSPGQGSYQDMLGQTNYKGPVPNFNGYNPATNFPSQHNFYPTS